MKNLFPILLLALTSPAWPEQIDYHSVVAADGSGDFTGIQEAIDSSKAFPGKRITLFIKSGVYREKVKVHEWNTSLSLVGENRGRTIIVYNDHFRKIGRGGNSTFHTATVQVDGDDFSMENLTVKNSAGPSDQAVALAVNADRAYFDNVNVIGNQDSLYLTGAGKRKYFKNCYIEGTTDFIFGRATAVFENCRIHSKADSYITAASTPEGIEYGFVFIGCRLTADEGINNVYLGRPWRPFARTVFIHTEMDAHIRPEGWHNWSKPEAEKSVFYAEYGNTGKGANPAKRVGWSRQLSKRQANRYRPDRILGKWIFSGKQDER
ncbi:MAG TPA: pectinesterase family protein [Gammaproteobacteria bacterium]